MKRFAQMVIAGLLTCSGLVSGPLAQENTAQEEAVEDVPVVANQPAAEAIPFSDEPSLLYATELMQRAELYAEAISKVAEVPEVEVLEVSELPRVDAAQDIFEDTIARFITYYEENLAALRDAIAANPVVAQALEDAGVELSNVLAAEIAPDLALRVYVRDW